MNHVCIKLALNLFITDSHYKNVKANGVIVCCYTCIRATQMCIAIAFKDLLASHILVSNGLVALCIASEYQYPRIVAYVPFNWSCLFSTAVLT